MGWMTEQGMKRARPYLIWGAVTLAIKAISPSFSKIGGNLPSLFTGILLLYGPLIYYWMRGEKILFLKVKSVGKSLLFFTGMLFVSAFAYFLFLTLTKGAPGAEKISLLFTGKSFRFWFSSLLVTSLPEEFFFRGFLFDAVEGGAPKKIVITSLLFCVTHVVVSFSPLRLLTFIPGIALAYLRDRTSEIYSPILLHTFFNIIYWAL